MTYLKVLQEDSAKIDKMKEMKLFGEEDIDSVLQNVKVGKLERQLEREMRKRKQKFESDFVPPVRLVDAGSNWECLLNFSLIIQSDIDTGFSPQADVGWIFGPV